MKRKGRRDWKPVDELREADFRRHPLWGFDLSAEEDGADSDETWVRPWVFKRVPRESDTLFLAADVGEKRGFVTFQFTDGEPEVDGIGLLSPRYQTFSFSPWFDDEREKRTLKKLAPLDYRAKLTIGKTTFVLAGVMR